MRSPAFLLCLVLCLLTAPGTTACARTTSGGAEAPEAARANDFDITRLETIEPLVREEIADKKLPGAVVLVGRGDRVGWQKVIGNRALEPQVEAMTADTIFDAASLTKVVATTTAAMILIEEGKIRLSDRVATYIPGFERYNKGGITIRHLMTHMSGLRPDVDLGFAWVGYDTAIELAIEEVPMAPPGERFIYSDIGYFVLADIIRRVSGQTLDAFTRDRIFEPLGMTDTMFLPPASLIPRIAPTQLCTRYGWPCEGEERIMLRGIVHDPTARREFL